MDVLRLAIRVDRGIATLEFKELKAITPARAPSVRDDRIALQTGKRLKELAMCRVDKRPPDISFSERSRTVETI